MSMKVTCLLALITLVCCSIDVDSSLVRRTVKDTIEISGYISFDKIPKTIPSNSRLTVRFKDSRVADAPSVTLARTIVKLDGYSANTTQLMYAITSERPSEYGHYNVDGLLNMGWIPTGDEGIRSGDYHTATSHPLHYNSNQRHFVTNITLELYTSSCFIATYNTGLISISLLLISAFI